MNWKKAFEDLERESKIAQKNKDAFKGTNQAVNEKFNNLTAELKNEREKAEKAKQIADDLIKKYADKTLSEEEAQKLVVLATTKLQGQVDKYEIENKTLAALIEKRDKKALELEQQKDQYFKEAQQAINEKDLAVSRMEQLQKTLKEKELALAKVLVKGDDGPAVAKIKGKFDPNPPPFYIKGQVEKVHPEDNTLVEISLGSDHGMAVGQTLEAFRTSPAAKYLGMVQIVEVTAHKSVARLIPSPYAPPVALKTGDQVASSLKASY
jgi:hypothetical protein